MKKLLPLLIFVSVAQITLAQKFTISGKILDETGNGLPSATVMVLYEKDSTLVTFGVSDVDGAFEIKSVPKANYLFKVTFIGYDNYLRKITAPEGPILDIGAVKMAPGSAQLDEVVIKGEANPVTVKKDTIEFNAGSFKTQVNANVEDLLKKLPGVEVDTDGNVTAQGETVQQVLVDGREFFGRDPKLATRGLPADAVSKVQVFDKKSDQARFSGVDDGVRQKTINLELKDDRKNMTFGNAMAGGGADVTDNKIRLTGDETTRYQSKVSINKFGGGKQISLLAMGNNVNEQGFTGADLGQVGFGGGPGGGFGGGGQPAGATGIATNYGAGLNYNRDITKKSKLTSNYFYSYTDNNLVTQTDQSNAQGDINQFSGQYNTTNSHKVNLRIDQEIDSANLLTVVANPTYTSSKQKSTIQSETLAPGNQSVARTSDQDNSTDQSSKKIASNMLWNHRFSTPGRTMSANLSLTLSEDESVTDLTSENKTGNQLQNVSQRTRQKSGNQTYGTTLNYSEPVGERKYLQFSYDFSANVNQLDKRVIDNLNNEQQVDSLSNTYNNTVMANKPGLSMRFLQRKSNVSVGVSYQNTQLRGEFVLTDEKVNRTFSNLLPAIRYNYDFTSFRHLILNYLTSMTTPSFTQLNPVPDVSNQANISQGNPDLDPSYIHSVSANYTSFNPNKFIFLFSTVNATYGLNSIVNSQISGPFGVRTTMPVNVKDNLNLSANVAFGFPVSKLKSRITLGPTARYTHGINVTNYLESATEQQTLGGTVRYNLSLGTIYVLDLSANLSHSDTKYENTMTADQEYFNKIFNATSNLQFPKNYQFNTVFTYTMTNTISTGYKLNVPMLNAAFSRFIFSNKAGEVKVGVNNILNKSQNVTQTVDQGTGSLTTTTSNNLGRYFMISFTYALNKNLNPAGTIRLPGGPPPGGF